MTKYKTPVVGLKVHEIKFIVYKKSNGLYIEKELFYSRDKSEIIDEAVSSIFRYLQSELDYDFDKECLLTDDLEFTARECIRLEKWLDMQNGDYAHVIGYRLKSI